MSIDQLESLIDATNLPTIETAFKNTASDYYWSSTTYAGNTGYAWIVHFYNGNQFSYGKTRSSYVRCVRAGQYFDSLDFNNTLLFKNFITNFQIKSELETQTEYESRLNTYEIALNAQLFMSGYDADNESLSVIVGGDIIDFTEPKGENIPFALSDAKTMYKKSTLATFNATFGYKYEYETTVLYIKKIALIDGENNNTGTTQIILDETTKNYCQANPSACGIEFNVTMNGFTQDDINNATQFDTTLLENAQSGWSLLGTKSEITDMSIFDSVKIVWVYKENTWNVYTSNTAFQELIAKNSSLGQLTKIGANEGFWIFK